MAGEQSSASREIAGFESQIQSSYLTVVQELRVNPATGLRTRPEERFSFYCMQGIEVPLSPDPMTENYGNCYYHITAKEAQPVTVSVKEYGAVILLDRLIVYLASDCIVTSWDNPRMRARFNAHGVRIGRRARPSLGRSVLL